MPHPHRLEEAGLGRIKGGTLYPILSEYESSGLLTASWQEGEGGPGRKVFSIPRGDEKSCTTSRSDGLGFRLTQEQLSTHKEKNNDHGPHDRIPG
ncbi:PadR family transcriptional regulator [Nesterenkonia ebinurensis]|uniref:PadR family transcriptional regulator n=1 Tax=Nesterenkonia ebinurensis TaxID=2608252 RepID=UPI001CC530FA